MYKNIIIFPKRGGFIPGNKLYNLLFINKNKYYKIIFKKF